jgi:hypothetical protein
MAMIGGLLFAELAKHWLTRGGIVTRGWGKEHS